MKSLIFSVLVRILNPILIVVSFWLFVRGHNAPGGGFIAGLIAAAVSIMKILDGGWSSLHPRLRDNLFPLAGFGLLVAMFSGAMALLIQNPFMTGRWTRVFGVELGTPLLFDLGVMIVVFAVVTITAGYLLQEDEEEAA